MSKIKILTFQHKSVEDTLIKDGLYMCNIISDYNKKTPNAYKFLAEELYKKCGEKPDIPIFGWSKVFDDKDFYVDNDTISRMLDMTFFDVNEYVLLKLIVPEKYVLLTNFYEFVYKRCKEEFPNDEEYQSDDIINKSVLDVSNTQEIQAIIPFIKYEWLASVYILSESARYMTDHKNREKF